MLPLATLPLSVVSLKNHGARTGLVGAGLPGRTLNTSFLSFLLISEASDQEQRPSFQGISFYFSALRPDWLAY